MFKQHFFKKLKKGENYPEKSTQVMDWKVVYDINTAHEDMVETPGLRGAHKREKPVLVIDYNKCKTEVRKSDQMLQYCLFHKSMVRWWKKLFFFCLAVINSHILHYKESNEMLK
jgi:hypothetical protein